jgi:hypothetical protein
MCKNLLNQARFDRAQERIGKHDSKAAIEMKRRAYNGLLEWMSWKNQALQRPVTAQDIIEEIERRKHSYVST